MIEAYKIGIELLITGGATEKMQAFTASLDKATRASNKFTSSLAKLNEQLARTDTLMDGIMPKVDAFGARLNESLRAANVEMGSLNRKMGAADFMGGGRGFGGGRHGGLGGEFGRHGGRDIAGGIGGMAGGVLGGFGGAAGIGLIGLGLAGKAGFGAQTEFQAAAAQLKAQGFSPQANAALIQQAITSQIQGVSRIQMLEAMSDAAVVTKNPMLTGQLAPTIARMLFSNRVIFGQLGQRFSRTDEQNLLRAAELKTGSLNPAVLERTLNMFQKLLTVEGGPTRLPPATIAGFMRRAQASGRALSEQGFVHMIPIIQAMTGPTAGRQMRGLQSALFGGTLSKTKRSEFERLGILDPTKVQQNIIGQTVGIKADAVKSAGLLSTDPVTWINTVLEPALLKAGFRTTQQQTIEFYRLLPQAYTGILAQSIENQKKIAATSRSYVTAAGIPQTYGMALNLNAGNVKALAASFKNLETSFGKLVSPSINKGIKNLTAIVNGLTAIFDVLGKVRHSGMGRALVNASFNAATGGIGGMVGIGSHLYHAVTNSLLGGIHTAKPVPTQSSSNSSHIYMDGRKVGQIVQKHMVDSSNMPPSHGSDIDFRQTLVPTQLNAVR